MQLEIMRMYINLFTNIQIIACITQEGGHVAFGDEILPTKKQYCDRLAVDWINYHNCI